VIGSQPYEVFASDYAQAVVIAGFEPLDVMQAILMLVRQINDGRAAVENEFTRAVTREGNRKAQALVDEVFELRDSFELARSGSVPHSALQCVPEYAAFDAERASPFRMSRCPTTRPASAARSCAAKSDRKTARFSARYARPQKPGRLLQLYRRKALARRTTLTGASAPRLPESLVTQGLDRVQLSALRAG